jgi:hypothetical protein
MSIPSSFDPVQAWQSNDKIRLFRKTATPAPPRLSMLTLEEYEKLNPRREITHQGMRIVFATPTTHTKWRVDSLFAFVKTYDSYHGVEPIKETGIRRDLLLYDIKVDNPSELKQPAPAAAVRGSNFTF